MRASSFRALLLILASIASFSATAQRGFNYKHYSESSYSWQRVHISLTKPVASIQMKYNYSGINHYGKKESDSYTKKLPQRSYGFGIGSFFPLAKVSKASKLAIGADVMFNMYEWDVIKNAGVMYNTGTHMYQVADVVVAGSFNMGIPVTLDYRTGCDAMQSKDYNTCFAIGAGVYTNWAATTYYEFQDANTWSARPIIKMEAGLRFGMCFKLRAMYQFGKISYFSYKNEYTTFDETLDIEGKGTFMLSLLIIPTAFSWSREM